MNTPAERQAQILQWLSTRSSIRLSELADRLHVSLMTVHRDTATLAEQGFLVKSHGAVQQPQLMSRTVELCPLCKTPIVDRLRFSFTTRSGETQEACCGHCAFMLAKEPGELTTLLATDYLYGRVISADQAHYVVDSRIAVCCKPSVLPFLTADDAADFATGFGGDVMTFEAVLAQFAQAR
jgi:DNA-binding Lrp family transcriptional regulator